MGNLTRHFNREEFNCPCCGLNKTDETLAKYVEKIRVRVGVPVTIISGTRCNNHNHQVGGVNDSSHLDGLASDIVAVGYSARALGKVIKDMWKKGELPELQYCYLIGVSSVHIDVDKSKKNKRWRIFAF